MAVKNNPDKFPEGYITLRGCGKRKLCRIFYVKRIAITIVFQKNMCNFAGLMLYILDFMVRCKVAYLTFYMAIFSAINFVMSFNLLTHTHTLITNNLYFLTVLGVIIHYLRIVMSNFSTKNTSKRIMYKVMQI